MSISLDLSKLSFGQKIILEKHLTICPRNKMGEYGEPFLFIFDSNQIEEKKPKSEVEQNYWTNKLKKQYLSKESKELIRSDKIIQIPRKIIEYSDDLSFVPDTSPDDSVYKRINIKFKGSPRENQVVPL